MYTANIVDTGLFRAIGKSTGERYRALEAAVTEANVTLRIAPTMYRELGGDPEAQSLPSGSEYVDDAIRDGWVAVADPVPGRPEDDYSDADTVVGRARHDAHSVIAKTTNHPKTVNEWNDTAIVGLALRLFERNERIRVIVHTTDRALELATRVVVPEYGYYDLMTRYFPPGAVGERFPMAENFTW